MSGDSGAVPAAAVAGLRLHGSLDLSEIAGLALDAAVPGLADVAAVFAVDRMLRRSEPAPAEHGAGATVRRLGARIGHDGRQSAEEIFPAGEVIALAPESPYARCLDNGEPVLFAQRDYPRPESARCGSEDILSRYPWVLAVPAVVNGQAVGFVAFARTAGSPTFSDADMTGAAELAAGTGAGIVNAVMFMRQRAIADTLQFGLLVAEPEVPPGIEAAARCLPAAGQVIGGDWYDMLALPGGRSGLIVGDVMGHGPGAAAAMAHLRGAAHALAQLDLEPAEMLGQLDQTTAMLREPVLATCAYAVIDPAARLCTLAAAGHLPPALAMPDGVTRVPDLPAGQSLGLGAAAYGQARIKLPPGAVIALFTDGLVETRTRSFDQGILAMQAILARHDGELDAICDHLIASLAQHHEDDVTVVLARCR